LRREKEEGNGKGPGSRGMETKVVHGRKRSANVVLLGKLPSGTCKQSAQGKRWVTLAWHLIICDGLTARGSHI
jgi:hypothetical protein